MKKLCILAPFFILIFSIQPLPTLAIDPSSLPFEIYNSAICSDQKVAYFMFRWSQPNLNPDKMVYDAFYDFQINCEISDNFKISYASFVKDQNVLAEVAGNIAITGVTAIVDKVAFKGWPVSSFAYAIVEPFTKINNPILEGGQKLQINAQIYEGIINRGQIYLFQVIADASRSTWPISCTCTGKYALMVKQGWQGTLPSPGPGTYSISNVYKVFDLLNTSTIMPPMNLRIVQ